MPQEAPLSNHPITPLASAQINHDRVSIELLEPNAKSVGIRPTQERAICESVLPPGQLRRKG
jgi:hypothetical protein